jgi:transcription elongation factor Elf1
MINSSVIETLSKLFKQKPHVQKGGAEILVFCPSCKHHKRKLNINTTTGYYQCWVCGFSGKSFSSLLKKLKATSDYYQILCKNKIKINYEVTEEKKTLILPEEFKPLCKSTNDIIYKHALNYCLKRNLTVHEIVRYNIGYCASGSFVNRVIIPSYDEDGNLNFYCGRDIYNSKLKYRLCDGSKDIIGFELFTDFTKPITIVEGPFDALSVKYNVVPLFGKTMSKKLKMKLIDYRPPYVNVLLDNDALDSSLKICDFLLSNNIEARLILLDGKDPNEIGHEKTWQTINSSVRIDESLLYRYKLTNKL